MDPLKILKELRHIAPRSGYSAESRDLLLRELQSQVMVSKTPLKEGGIFIFLREMFFTRAAFAAELTAFAVLVALLGVYLNRASNEKLVVQANEVNASIQVKLNEIKYLLEKPAPRTIEETEAIVSLLNDATEALLEANEDLVSEELEKSLEKMKVAEEAFLKIRIK